MSNVDPAEIAKFSELAHRWWDPQAEFRPLHEINPLRLEWIQRSVPLTGLRALDVGCGGGILAEGLAQAGAHVTGIDLSEKALSVAKLHLYESKLDIDYQCIAAEDFAALRPGEFDVVTCMEMLEHVPDPASIVQACARLLKPGGHVFFSTLNRTPKSYLYAIIGAEYIINILPRGTHEYAKFIKPAELAQFGRAAGLHLYQVLGLAYNPFIQKQCLDKNVSVNYLMGYQKDKS